MSHTARFQEAIRRFDEENSRDPNRDTSDGLDHPRELLYARRLSRWIDILAPDASEPLRLAARCQHLCRWEIPRSSFDMTRPGYLKWRTELKKFHARKSSAILREVGYDDETIRRVADLNLKKNFPADPECRVLEDALCLVFLEHQFADLASRTDAEKVVNAVRKSWEKMTPAARDHALQFSFRPREQALLEAALQNKD